MLLKTIVVVRENTMVCNMLYEHLCQNIINFFLNIYFTEVFPYIAHKCYVRSRNCEPTVRDCGVFDRLLACCCHHYLGLKCK